MATNYSQNLIMSTTLFLNKVQKYVDKFKQSNGFGKWLKEYERMDKNGLFEPTKVRKLYIDYLEDSFLYGYIQLSAIHYIAVQAFDETAQILANSEFCIMTNEGGIYVDEDGDEVTELEFSEALDICKAINDDALDYVVYIADCLTNSFIHRL